MRQWHIRVGDTSICICPNCGKLCPSVSLQPSPADLKKHYKRCKSVLTPIKIKKNSSTLWEPKGVIWRTEDV